MQKPSAAIDETPPVPVRWATVIAIALPLIVLNCGWIANSEMKTGVTELTISTLFLGITFILFLVTLLNLLVRRWAGPQTALRQPEMMVLYSMLSMSSVVAGVGNLGFFTPFLANPFYYQTTSNGWQSFWHLLPSYIGPRDPEILRGFFLGHSSAWNVHILSAWAYPLTVWGLFFLVLLWTTLCLGSILRRRWEDEEHLPFPIIALPLEMTREGAPLYRQPLLWIGFGFPLIVHSMNSLQSIFPTLPTMKMNSVHDLIPDAALSTPWTGAGTIFYQLHPSGVGFGYLVNTDVSFSMWFFYLAKKALDIWATSRNWRDPATGWYADTNNQFPYFNYQGWGAWLALSLAALWTGRRYFRAYVIRAFRGDHAGLDHAEPMSARVAFFGFLIGFFALCAFVWSSGGSWWLPVAFFTVYLLLMVTLSRIRAETAMLSGELVWINPQTMIPTLTGTGALSPMDMTHISMLSWFNGDYRASAMPHQLEAFVGLRRAGGRLSPLVPALILAAAVGIAAALLWDLQLYYVNGADTGNVNSWRISKGTEPWSNLEHLLKTPKPANSAALGGLIAGAAIVFLLSALRARFVGFLLHPAAYALNMSFANDFFWGDLFIAWLIKSCLLRYGGITLYRRSLPFFLGLILGDYVTGSVWSLIGTFFHLSLFRTFAT
jgi:hypothetical protein